jgi:hypothetical protein
MSVNSLINQRRTDLQGGIADLLAKANQIRNRAERLLREASAFDELRAILGAQRQLAHVRVAPRQVRMRGRELNR